MHVRAWELWRRPRRVVISLLLLEAVAIAGLALIVLATEAPTSRQWLQWLALIVCGILHIQLTRRQEERRRTGRGTVIVDFMGIWVFPAILLVPPSLIVLLVLVIRVQRWFVARRPAFSFTFSSISHAFAACLAKLAYVELGPHDWGNLTLPNSFHEFAVLLVTALVYEGVQVLYVGGVLALGASSPNPTVRGVLGSTADNLIEAVTIGLGAAAAILLVFFPPLVIVMVLVSVVFNRLSELGELQDDVRTDAKTGVLNMRGWTESAQRELSRTVRANGSLAVLMVDLDHFKSINDAYGHPAGDEALLATAQALDETTRPSDLVGRFGGEEFLILLPDTEVDAARLAADRIREGIAHLRIGTTDKRGGHAVITERTTSVGIAVFPQHGATLDELTQAADAAVYEAKEAGRNQARMAPDLPQGRAESLSEQEP